MQLGKRKSNEYSEPLNEKGDEQDGEEVKKIIVYKMTALI